MKNLKPFMVILGVQPELLPQAHEATMLSSMFSRLPTPTSEPRKQRKTLRIGKLKDAPTPTSRKFSLFSLVCVCVCVCCRSSAKFNFGV